MSDPLQVWVLNPYAAGSHRAWSDGFTAASRHRTRALTMDGHFWKWRLQGGAMELAAQAAALAASGERADVLLTTSMVNLPAFLGLARRSISWLADTPVVLYMHENQLTYPPPPNVKRDLTYAMMQHLSMLAADVVCFNSAYHLAVWYDELPRLLKHFPDYSHLDTITTTRARSCVLPVGCDLQRFDHFPAAERADLSPLVLWNQRWEYDKAPAAMLRALYDLAEEGVPFRVALAGENFRVVPEEFAAARERLGSRLVHYGYLADAADYARLLRTADVVLSTAVHEFFGVSVVEAIYCGCRPVLPNRLSYPELIPPGLADECLYDDEPGLRRLLCRAVTRRHPLPGLREAMAGYDWSVMAPRYDALLDEMPRLRG